MASERAQQHKLSSLLNNTICPVIPLSLLPPKSDSQHLSQPVVEANINVHECKQWLCFFKSVTLLVVRNYKIPMFQFSVSALLICSELEYFWILHLDFKQWRQFDIVNMTGIQVQRVSRFYMYTEMYLQHCKLSDRSKKKKRKSAARFVDVFVMECSFIGMQLLCYDIVCIP